MHKIMVVGAGKIGSLIACLLVESGDYEVHLVDQLFRDSLSLRLAAILAKMKTAVLDVQDQAAFETYIRAEGIECLISCLPYFLNPRVATIAAHCKTHYFDLTEDARVTAAVRQLAANSDRAFVPQCGLAPGFINIVAHSLIQEFEHCHKAHLRVGALPERSHNALGYSLTWSTDGLINEYAKPSQVIEEGQLLEIPSLDGLERLELDGAEYEAFYTHGGIGNLIERYQGKIQALNYKTIRYPGHCAKMRFLMQDLGLKQEPELLKTILEQALPKTYQDLVLVYVSTQGLLHGELIEKQYFKKIYPELRFGIHWSAIQLSTASGLCAVLDLLLQNESTYTGLVLQESFPLNDLVQNRFGCIFAS